MGLDVPPVSVAGGVLVALAGQFCVHVFVAVDGHAHSASDTLHGIYPFVVPTLIALQWIAPKASIVRG